MGHVITRVEVAAIQRPSNNVPHFVGISQLECLWAAAMQRSTEA